MHWRVWWSINENFYKLTFGRKQDLRAYVAVLSLAVPLTDLPDALTIKVNDFVLWLCAWQMNAEKKRSANKRRGGGKMEDWKRDRQTYTNLACMICLIPWYILVKCISSPIVIWNISPLPSGGTHYHPTIYCSPYQSITSSYCPWLSHPSFIAQLYLISWNIWFLSVSRESGELHRYLLVAQWVQEWFIFQIVFYFMLKCLM